METIDINWDWITNETIANDLILRYDYDLFGEHSQL